MLYSDIYLMDGNWEIYAYSLKSGKTSSAGSKSPLAVTTIADVYLIVQNNNPAKRRLYLMYCKGNYNLLFKTFQDSLSKLRYISCILIGGNYVYNFVLFMNLY